MTHEQLEIARHDRKSIVGWPGDKPVPAAFIACMQWHRVNAVIRNLKVYEPNKTAKPKHYTRHQLVGRAIVEAQP
jgi:hypothetical protein